MKSKIICMLILSCALLLPASCYREDAVVNSYTVDKKEFNFSVGGGTETAHLLRRGGKKIKEREIDWHYMGCASPEADLNFFRVKMKIDTLTDGSVKIYNEWITFSSPKDRKTIKIDTKENTTGKERVIHLVVGSGALAFTLTVKQDK